MRALFLAGWNCVRFFLLRFYCPGFQAKIGQLLGLNTRIVVKKTSKVSLGKKLVSDGRLTIIVQGDGRLEIGDRVYFNENMMISCIEHVTIGPNCLFGPHVCIYDSNHEFSAEEGIKPTSQTAPVSIGSGCWIGANTVILKGSTIGKNCVIGAGCIVSGNIPDGSVVTMERKLKVRKIGE